MPNSGVGAVVHGAVQISGVGAAAGRASHDRRRRPGRTWRRCNWSALASTVCSSLPSRRPSTTRGLRTGCSVCQDTTISDDASAPNCRCSPATGGVATGSGDRWRRGCGLSVSGSDQGRRHHGPASDARGGEQLATTEFEVEFGVLCGHRGEVAPRWPARAYRNLTTVRQNASAPATALATGCSRARSPSWRDPSLRILRCNKTGISGHLRKMTGCGN